MKIVVEAVVIAPIAEVWRAYTSPEDIQQWNAASDNWHTTRASVDLRVGGAFSSRMEAKDGSVGFDFEGTYTNVQPERLLEYSFGDRTAQVEFDGEASGVRVRVTFDSESTHPVELQKQGWQAILDNFKKQVAPHPPRLRAASSARRNSTRAKLLKSGTRWQLFFYCAPR
ncbi:MAG: SRPBCC family protein [Polyangiaceae bacterium]|nr:SRPBCC family protein [Polyangiaceae bacterium]